MPIFHDINMDISPLLVVHYNNFICIRKKEVSTLHNSFNECKDDIMHCFNHSPPTSICSMFFKVIFHLQDVIQLTKSFKFIHWMTMDLKVAN